MLHHTEGIVLRAVKYSETSLVVTVFTELFGLQTYMVRGVRQSKKGSNQAALYQPGAMLQLVVYHNPQKNLQYIREAEWKMIYRHIFSDVTKHCVAVFMIELLLRSLKQPEANTDLYYFCHDAFEQLDTAERDVVANFALFFALHLPHFFGFRFDDAGYTHEMKFLDLTDGRYTTTPPAHAYFLEGDDVLTTSELLKVMQPHELSVFKLSGKKRNDLLQRYMDYYNLHIQDFGQMKTLPVLQQVLG
ncbi:MAG TPA: DNA repair protein RecO [Ferruginibacter sp.]|nr:DNA repair protein RecO [Ferruginibacter sp.]HRN80540.1 DNA repair protein RecO [Ferruginibacter sp.]HRO18578.1 DNA repair protein RecO [Ferruginibacter sp.]HRQ21746.1 DNA repair protein RecO [Ferruginibacter sp.]